MGDLDVTQQRPINPALRRQQHREWIRDRARRQNSARARTAATYAIAQRTGDEATVERAGLARHGVARLGLDGGRFYAMPEWYQTMIEGPEPKPGFFGRMAQRVKDGDLMSRRGHMGFRAATGQMPIDDALNESTELRKQLSEGSWVEGQGGVLPWIERNAIGQAMEIVGQQARHIPAGLLLSAGGAFLGSLAGPAGTARGAQIGGMVGLAGANSKMIAGNAYLDFMEEPLKMPDGTAAKMPHDIARNMAFVIGAFDGAIETVQMATIFGKVPGFSAVQRKAQEVLMRKMTDGTLRAIAQRAGIGMLTSTAANTAQEMVQETAAVLGQELAYELVRNQTGAQRIHAQELGKAIMETLGQTAMTAPAFAFLSLPAGVEGVRVGAAHRKALRDPATYFNLEAEGAEDMAIGDLVVPATISERQTALTKILLDQARRGTVRLPPIEVTPRDDGKFVVNKPEHQAIVAGLQAIGVERVRGLDLQARAEEEAQEKAEAMKPATETTAAPEVEVEEPAAAPAEVDNLVPKEAVQIRSLTDFEAVRETLLAAVDRTELTEEQITGATIILEYRAQALGMTLAEYVDERFQEGILADEVRATQMLGTPAPEQVPSEPPPVEAGAPPEPAPSAAPVSIDPTTADYDAASLAPISDFDAITGDRGATVVWEDNAGTAHVVGGRWRVGLAQRAAERADEPVSVPAYRFREADGVTLQEARQRGRMLSDQSGQTATDIARVLRRLPAAQRFQDVPVSQALHRDALGLAALTESVWELVNASRISPVAGAQIGRLIPEDATMQEEMAAAFEINPPISTFEAGSRIRQRLATEGPARTDRERTHLARVIGTMAGTRSRNRLTNAVAATIGQGGPLHEEYQREAPPDEVAFARAMELWVTGDQPDVRRVVERALSDLRGAAPGSGAAMQRTRDHARALLGVLTERRAELRRSASAGAGEAMPVNVSDALFERASDGNLTEDIDQAAYIGRDGTMIRRPPGRYSASAMLDSTGAVRISTAAKMLRAAMPLSREQRTTILGALADRDTTGWRLEFTAGERRIATLVTEQRISDLTLRAHFSRGQLFQGAKGAVEFDAAGRAIIALSEAADFGTLMHEFAHVFRRELSADQEEAVAGWTGAYFRDGGWVWTREAEEKFANGFMAWLATGDEAGYTDATRSVFERAMVWLRGVYAVRDRMKPEVRATFETMLLNKEAPEVVAFARNRAALGDQERHTFTDPDGREMAIRNAKGAGWAVDMIGEDGQRAHTRFHQEVDDAVRDVSGVPTVANPAPLGNALMGAPTVEAARRGPATVEEAALRLASDDVTVGDALKRGPAPAETILYQEDEGPGDVARQAAGRSIGFEVAEAERSYERALVIRFARARIRDIRNDLARVAREASTLPEDVRTPLRKLLSDLNLRRMARDRTDAETLQRAEPGPAGTQTDPLRLMAVLKPLLDPEDMPPGLLTDWGGQPFAAMKLIELERLRNTVLHVYHSTRAEQDARREETKAQDAQNRIEAQREVQRISPTRKPNWVQSLGELFGERPDYQIERIGGGIESTTFRVLWEAVKRGALQERVIGDQARADFEKALRREGITRSERERELWLNERIEVPDWATQIKKRWRRGDLMTLAMLARDPYAVRNLLHEEGGIVMSEGRGAQPTEPTTLTLEQLRELGGLLGDEERRFISRPVRDLFDGLFSKVNATFREKHGFDLERWPNYFPVAVANVAKPGDFDTGNALEHFRYLGERGVTPFKGMVQFRTGAIKPVVVRPLSPVLNQALRHGAAYAALELPLTHAGKLIYDRKFAALLRERVSNRMPERIRQYLRDVAHVYDTDDLLDMLGGLRHAVTVASLGMNFKVATSQALSYPIYGLYVPERYLAQAIGQMAVDGRQIIARHTKYDPDFRQRTNTGFDADLRARQAGRSLLPPVRSRFGSERERFTHGVMAMIGAVDKATVGTGMQAAVNHALDVLRDGGATNKMREVLHLDQDGGKSLDPEQRLEMAYKWANWVTSRTQPMFLSEHMNAFARNKVLKIFTMFSGYTNAAANALRYSVREAKDAGWQDPEKNARAAKAVFTIGVLNPLGVGMLAYLQSLIMRGEEETDPLWKILVQNMISGLGSLAGYGVRDVGYSLAYDRDLVESPTFGSLADLVDALQGIGRAISSGDSDRWARAMERVTYASFRVLGVPISPLRYLMSAFRD